MFAFGKTFTQCVHLYWFCIAFDTVDQNIILKKLKLTFWDHIFQIYLNTYHYSSLSLCKKMFVVMYHRGLFKPIILNLIHKWNCKCVRQTKMQTFYNRVKNWHHEISKTHKWMLSVNKFCVNKLTKCLFNKLHTEIIPSIYIDNQLN